MADADDQPGYQGETEEEAGGTGAMGLDHEERTVEGSIRSSRGRWPEG